jgi:signal transduction histidine kinase
VAAVFGVQSSLYLSATGEHVPWTSIAAWAASEWYTWAVLSPLIVLATRRWPLEGAGLWPSVPVHLTLSLVLGVGQAVLQAAMKFAGIGGDLRTRPFDAILWSLLVSKAQINPVTYWVIAVVTQLSVSRRRSRDREAAAEHLRALLAESQLQALRAQLNPHFLFNALNAISDLIHTDPKTATRMVARLGDFLRLTLKGAGRETTTLRTELEFVDSYLDVERVRFEDRLHVAVDVPEQVLDVPVPPLILQPLVENAIRHGVSRVQGAGLVRVVARLQDGMVQIDVRDNGPGWSPDPHSNGLGLANTRARLDRAYAGRASLEVRAEDGDTRVSVRFPWASSPAPVSA